MCVFFYLDMDLGNNSAVKTPEAENETPTRIQAGKGSPFSNGVFKRHAPTQFHHLGLGHHHPIVVTYKECLKNHAAAIGGHAVDGCGEFMPSPNSNPVEPTSLKCAACGCHRNFHRREPDDPPTTTAPAIEYRPLHRHRPPPPRAGDISGSPDNSPSSPPPISSSYYPNMLLALSHGLSGTNAENATPISAAASGGAPALMYGSGGGRKRHRTKFTQYQKDKMLGLADRVCWKMQKKDEELIQDSCRDMGVEKGVFKVWMHNNKNTLGRRVQNQSENISNPSANTNGNDNHNHNHRDSAAYGYRHPGSSGDDVKLNIIDGREMGQFHHLHDISNVEGLVTATATATNVSSSPS